MSQFVSSTDGSSISQIIIQEVAHEFNSNKLFFDRALKNFYLLPIPHGLLTSFMLSINLEAACNNVVKSNRIIK